MSQNRVVWAIRGFFNRILNVIARNVPGSRSTRVFLQKLRGVKFKGRVSIASGVYFDDEFPELIEIGDDVSIGVNAVLIAHFRDEPMGIKIGDHAFIGPGAIILNDVEIGEGAVVSAGSVVNKTVLPYTMVGGVPAKPLYKIGAPLGDEKPDYPGSVRKFKESRTPI